MASFKSSVMMLLLAIAGLLLTFVAGIPVQQQSREEGVHCDLWPFCYTETTGYLTQLVPGTPVATPTVNKDRRSEDVFLHGIAADDPASNIHIPTPPPDKKDLALARSTNFLRPIRPTENTAGMLNNDKRADASTTVPSVIHSSTESFLYQTSIGALTDGEPIEAFTANGKVVYLTGPNVFHNSFWHTSTKVGSQAATTTQYFSSGTETFTFATPTFPVQSTTPCPTSSRIIAWSSTARTLITRPQPKFSDDHKKSAIAHQLSLTTTHTTCTTEIFNGIPLNLTPLLTNYAATTTHTSYVPCGGCTLEVIDPFGIGPEISFTTTTTVAETKTVDVVRCSPS